MNDDETSTFIPHCECGKEDITKCYAEKCDAEWLPVIYIDPDWPVEPEEEDADA